MGRSTCLWRSPVLCNLLSAPSWNNRLGNNMMRHAGRWTGHGAGMRLTARHIIRGRGQRCYLSCRLQGGTGTSLDAACGTGKDAPNHLLATVDILGSTSNMVQLTGTLYAVGVSLPDFWRMHQPLGDVAGFDLRACNSMLGDPSAHRSYD